MWYIFLVSHIFTSYFPRLKAREKNRKNMKNLKNICHVALGSVNTYYKSIYKRVITAQVSFRFPQMQQNQSYFTSLSRSVV